MKAFDCFYILPQTLYSF